MQVAQGSGSWRALGRHCSDSVGAVATLVAASGEIDEGRVVIDSRRKFEFMHNARLMRLRLSEKAEKKKSSK